MDKSAFETVLSTKSGVFMDKIESTGVSVVAPKSHRGRKGRRGLGRLSPNNKEAG